MALISTGNPSLSSSLIWRQSLLQLPFDLRVIPHSTALLSEGNPSLTGSLIWRQSLPQLSFDLRVIPHSTALLTEGNRSLNGSLIWRQSVPQLPFEGSPSLNSSLIWRQSLPQLLFDLRIRAIPHRTPLIMKKSLIGQVWYEEIPTSTALSGLISNAAVLWFEGIS